MPTQYSATGRSAAELAADIERAVREGRLVPGDRLAPVRQVAAAAGVSPNTAAAAYSELARRGVVRTAGRSGTVISSGPPLPSRPRLVLPAGGRNLADGNPDPALLPDLGPALAALRPPYRLYGSDPVHPGLRVAALRGLEADGVPSGPLAVVGGALDGVERLLRAHLRAGDRVVVEEPGYAGIYDLVAANGFAAVPVPVDESGLAPEAADAALASGAGAVVLVPRAQNPTGAALHPGRAAALNAVFGRYPTALVVEDDHAGPVSGAPLHTTVAGLARWAFVRSFAKSLGPDLRVAAVVGDPETIARLEGHQSVGTGWVSHLLQGAVAQLLADKRTKPLLEAAARAYGQRRAAMTGALAAHGITATARSGLNLWVPVPEEQGVARALLDAGWAVSAGEPYRRGSPPAIRVTVAALQPGEAEAFAAALAGVLRPGASRSG